ncbi:hypothetical protein [Viridibacillus arvi]|uniref:hypothetical protein n=1 Tax=Viridibacillus arvi TaxID=263475 RepID=UPI003D05EC27
MSMIGFSNNPHIAIMWLDAQNPELSWNHYVERNADVFTKIDEMVKEGFDYYFINDILIIPNSISNSTQLNLVEGVYIEGLHIKVNTFIAFFHIVQKDEGIIFADSLTLPEFNYLKQNLKIIKRR